MNIFRTCLVVLAASVLSATIAGCLSSPSETTAPELEAREVDEVRFATWIAQHQKQHQARHDAMAFPRMPSASPGGGPVPIPGGLAPGLHVFLPGPIDLGFGGLDHEPSTITNFLGFSAIAYLAGVVTADDGNEYDMFHDMRVYRGLYRNSEGRTRFGTFAFI